MHIPVNEVVEIIHYGVPKEPERKNNKLVFTRVRFLLILSLISCIVAISGATIMGCKLYYEGMLNLSLNVFCLGFFMFFLVLSFLGLMSYRNSRIEYYPNGFFYCYNTWGTQ